MRTDLSSTAVTLMWGKPSCLQVQRKKNIQHHRQEDASMIQMTWTDNNFVLYFFWTK